MTTTTIIPGYSLPSYQLSYIIFFFFFFCILYWLYISWTIYNDTKDYSNDHNFNNNDEYLRQWLWQLLSLAICSPIIDYCALFFSSFFFFSFYINCILIRLYTMTPRATAPTVSTTMTMLSTVMTTRMTITQQLQITW